MFDDVISTGLQAVLAEIFESVDKNQLNVSLVGDIFKESHLELTDLRLKKTLLKDMNLPVEVKEGLVGKLVIQGLSGVMTGDPVTVTVGEVLVLLTPGTTLSDSEAGLAARRMAAALREMFANRYAEDFLEDALGVKAADKLSVQSQNKLNRKLLRHMVRKVLSDVSIILQAVHIRFELPAGGLDGAAPVKNSAGVGGGGACDAVGLMVPSLTVRTCKTDHPAFTKFAAQTPLERVAKPKGGQQGGADGRGSPQRESATTMARREQDALQGDRKNFMIVRKRATAANLQVYCDYGVDSYVTSVAVAVAAARNKATNPRPGTSGSLPGGGLAPTANNRGAAAAAKAVRALFLQKWKSERHALLFKPLAVEIGAEVHQWDQPGGKSIAPTYRVARLNVGVGELQAVVDSEQGRVVGAVVDEIVNLVRRSRFNRFIPQAYLPLRNLPPPKVHPPKPAKGGAPAGMLPSVETWSWASEMGGKTGVSSPKSAAEALLVGGFAKEGGAWARAMWRFAGACVRHDIRLALTKKLPASLPNWDGTISAEPSPSPGHPAVVAKPATNGVSPAGMDPASSSLSWRVAYLRLHARTLLARDAKSLGSSGGHRGVDVRRLGVPKGREPLSLEEMWDVAKVESFAPGDEVVFLRTAAKISSHYEWNRARKARAAARSAASQKGASPEAVAAAAGAAAAAAAWTVKDDAALLRSLDKLRASRVAAAVAAAAAKSGAVGGAGGAAQEEDEEEDDEDISKLQFAASSTSGFSDDDDDSDEDEDSEDDDEDSDDDSEEGGITANGAGAGGGGSRFTLADIAAKAKQAVSSASASGGAAGTPQKGGGADGGASSLARKGGVGSGKAAKIWGKLLGLPRVVLQVESAGIELRTRIAGGARKPLVALSAVGLTGTLEGDEARQVLWWELRVGNVTLRDLCSSWGDGAKNKGTEAAAPSIAKTLMSGSPSGVDGRDWVSAGDPTGAASRCFLVVRMVHDPNRAACGMFSSSAAAMAQLRAHVVVGCVTGKIPPQVLAVFNAAARDIVINEKKTNAGMTPQHPRASASGGDSDSAARQLRVVLGSVHRALLGKRSVMFRLKKRKGPTAAVRALSMARGATRSSSTSGEVDSKELYRVVAGFLPGDFEVRVHASEVIVQVSSRAEDLLEAGKVALEALGETKAAADMKGGAAAADSIDLEVDLIPVKVDACRRSRPSPEFWVDTGILRTKLRAPEKAVEAVVTALLTSAQRTTAAVALLSGGSPPADEEEDVAP